MTLAIRHFTPTIAPHTAGARRVASGSDNAARPAVSVNVALNAQKITESRKDFNERVSMGQVATGTVAQFSAFLDGIRLEVQRTTSHVAANVDRLGLDSALKSLTADLDRASTNGIGGVRPTPRAASPAGSNVAAIRELDAANELLRRTRASILENAGQALQAHANGTPRRTLSLLRP